MVSLAIKLVYVVICVSRAWGLLSNPVRWLKKTTYSTRIQMGKMGMPEHMTEGDPPSAEEIGGEKVTVRFLMGRGKKDVVVEANLGANLMLVGDESGVKMPRACRTGLCGTCTTSVKDPMAVVTASNPREGWATIRACSTKCYPPPGLDEMIIDTEFTAQRAARAKNLGKDGAVVENVKPDGNPMERFSGDWEREFKPSWELNKGELRPGMKLSRDELVCSNCAGSGQAQCYNCDGVGKTTSGRDKVIQCSLCVGQGTITCSGCKGKGIKSRRRKLRM